jgi:multimeric flavodoxin WrbA
MTNLDYLLQISGDLDDGWLKDLIEKINSIDGIILAFPLDPATLKSRKKLLQ